VRCADRYASTLRARARPGHVAQPGAHEHGTESDRGLREAPVSPAAESVSARNVSESSAALRQVRGGWMYILTGENPSAVQQHRT